MSPQPQVHLTAIRQPAFLYGPDGRIVEANDRAEALAGRSLAGCSAADVIAIFGNRHLDGTLFVPEDLHPSRTLAGEEAIDVPLSVTASDGRTVHVLATASPLRDGDEIIGALVVWQDVSALEAALAERARLHFQSEVRAEGLFVQEQVLRRQGDEIERKHRFLDAILGTLPHRVTLWDRDERLVWANEHFAAEHGQPREALIGLTWRDFWDDPDLVGPLVDEGLRVILTGAPVSREVEVSGTAGAEWRSCTFLPFGTDALLVITEDITERKRAAEALRESEERLRLAQERANIAVWDRDVGTGAVTHTPEFLRLYGLEADSVDQYEAWRERVHPDDIGRLESERDAALVRGEPFDTEFRIVRPSGETRWLQAIGRGITDESGTLVRVLGVNIDITARKAAEEALSETVEQYRQALNNPLLGYALCEIITDGAGRPLDFVYLDVNPAFEAFTDLSRDAVLNRRVTEVIVPEEVAEIIQLYGNVALTGESRTFQYPIPSLGKWYEVAAFSPQHGRFIAFFKDITERKRAEKALAESEAKYRNLVELAPDAILIHQDGTIVFANPAAAAMLGFGHPDDLVGRPVLEIVHPRTRDHVEWNIEADLRGEESPITAVDLVRPDGTAVTVQGRGAMIPFRGRPAIQVILRDVTEEKRVEEELRQSREWFWIMGETLPYGVWRCNAHGGAEYVSQSFLDLLEMTQEE